MQPYLGVSAFSSTVEKSVSERIHRSSGAIRLLFPDPIVSISSSTNIGQAREREKGRGRRGGRDRRGKSNMVERQTALQ